MHTELKLRSSSAAPGWPHASPSSSNLGEETPSSDPSEKLLQQIWEHQRLYRDQLRTLDGAALEVLHPGFWNHEPGPDFREALLRFDRKPAQSGDVELDLRPSGWKSHGHDQNPFYQRVILRVVWQRDGAAVESAPMLELKPFLDAPLPVLRDVFAAPPFPPFVPGKCAEGWQALSQPERDHLLRQAAWTRFQRKANELQAWARQAGWRGALWRGMMAGLGYKHNVWPMRRLGELLPQILPETEPLGLIETQARLFGWAQLLPNQLPRRARAAAYVRQAWDFWWRDPRREPGQELPKAIWRLAGVRPANHPLRRLALAAHWLRRGQLGEQLEAWLTQSIPDRDLPKVLLEKAAAPEDPFWSFHWSFNAAPLSAPQPLLGAQRLTDLAVNVWLPWLWARAQAGQNAALAERVWNRCLAWPPSEENTVLRLARKRLCGEAPLPLRSAAAQQGLLQIVRDFCGQSNALCQGCAFPEFLAFID